MDVGYSSDTRCELIKDKLLDITDCLERNNLFHNDIHRFNVFVNDNNDIFLKTNMDAGHAGKAGRYHQIDETAFMYSFILNSHNLL